VTETIELRTVKAQRGRRIRTAYRAQLGDYETEPCETPAAAKAAILKFAAAALTRPMDYDPILLPIPDGYIVVSRDGYGWGYHFNRDGHDSGWCMFPAAETTKEKVLAAARHHADSINEDEDAKPTLPAAKLESTLASTGRVGPERG